MAKNDWDDLPPAQMGGAPLTDLAYRVPAPTGLAKLRDPFPAHQISKLPKPTQKQTDEVKANFRAGVRCAICGGWHHPDVIHLDYVGHAALTDRLLDCDPAWDWEPLSLYNGLPVMDQAGGMWIKLTVCGITRLGYGHAGTKTGGDAIKEIIGDALRNAAMRFGAALDLWHKGDLHIDPPVSDEDAEWAESKAMEIRALMAKQDIAGAAQTLNSLGIGGSYDAEAKEAAWGRLESPVRSAIKAYDAITQAKTLDSLKRAWDAAPKHSLKMLEPVKEARKVELTKPEQEHGTFEVSIGEQQKAAA